jgi:hypothetical protein
MLKATRHSVKWLESKWQGLAIDNFRSRARRDFAAIARDCLEEKFTAHNFNSVAADANVNYAVIDA